MTTFLEADVFSQSFTGGESLPLLNVFCLSPSAFLVLKNIQFLLFQKYILELDT